MPVYGDVLRWNAVDVRGDDELLQHGDIINVVEGGLIIDFHCANQRARFIEYTRTFLCPFMPRKIEAEKEDLQVVLRRYPDGAWIWYPARTPVHGRFKCADAELMEIQLTEGTVRQLVPVGQIRAAPSPTNLKWHCVPKGAFVVRSCSLPAAYWLRGSQLLGEIFKRKLSQHYKVWCTSLLSQTVLYLQRATDSPLTSEQVESMYYDAKMAVAYGTSFDVKLLQLQWEREATKPRKVSGNRNRSLPLPVELLVEVFQSLDSIERIRCHRVCSLWDRILAIEANFPDVRVSIGHPDYGMLNWASRGIYGAALCLLKCLSRRTKMVIIMRCDDCFDSLAQLIASILAPDTVPTLVFYQCWWRDDDSVGDIVNGIVEELVECSVCERFVWKDCVIDTNFVAAHFSLYSSSVRQGDELKRLLWDSFEANNGCMMTLSSDVTEWISDRITGERNEEMKDKMVEVLNSFQSEDPRPSTHYRGRTWTTATLRDLDPSKLTPLTAEALTKCSDFKTESDSDD
ncbi:uncharacterized protein LOC129583074 [Paramacrobiotus metropolitanus]|uniref:uncharacterized protein LOC129583074 n=1 Tax=Paramacrobiotus metropolitanus TaxID=2943436 RepID=UPI00244598D9|nr:uncharacterized protein LOC129583074 [Paramacrobiotus metropolitanus]XP_055330756.1 uncharacterized protein LOC129583074 [Paramacrobiotus metropolitanus]